MDGRFIYPPTGCGIRVPYTFPIPMSWPQTQYAGPGIVPNLYPSMGTTSQEEFLSMQNHPTYMGHYPDYLYSNVPAQAFTYPLQQAQVLNSCPVVGLPSISQYPRCFPPGYGYPTHSPGSNLLCPSSVRNHYTCPEGLNCCTTHFMSSHHCQYTAFGPSFSSNATARHSMSWNVQQETGTMEEPTPICQMDSNASDLRIQEETRKYLELIRNAQNALGDLHGHVSTATPERGESDSSSSSESDHEQNVDSQLSSESDMVSVDTIDVVGVSDCERCFNDRENRDGMSSSDEDGEYGDVLYIDEGYVADDGKLADRIEIDKVNGTAVRPKELMSHVAGDSYVKSGDNEKPKLMLRIPLRHVNNVMNNKEISESEPSSTQSSNTTDSFAYSQESQENGADSDEWEIAEKSFTRSASGKRASATVLKMSKILHGRTTSSDEDLFERTKNKKKAKGEYTCSVCQKVFIYYSQLRLHEKQHIAKTCDQCGLVFPERIGLQNHKIDIHGMTREKAEAASKAVECSVCDEVFERFSDMVDHRTKVHDCRGKYNCPLCGTKFWHWQSRRAHLKECDKDDRVKGIKIQEHGGKHFKSSKFDKIEMHDDHSDNSIDAVISNMVLEI